MDLTVVGCLSGLMVSMPARIIYIVCTKPGVELEKFGGLFEVGLEVASVRYWSKRPLYITML